MCRYVTGWEPPNPRLQSTVARLSALRLAALLGDSESGSVKKERCWLIQPQVDRALHRGNLLVHGDQLCQTQRHIERQGNTAENVREIEEIALNTGEALGQGDLSDSSTPLSREWIPARGLPTTRKRPSRSGGCSRRSGGR